MPTGIITAGEVGRITESSGNAASDDKIVGYDRSTGKVVTFTPDQIANGANAVDGPSSATNNAIARWDTTTGKLLQDSGILVDDSDNMSGIGTIGSGAITSTGAVTSTAAKIDYDKFLGIDSVVVTTVGTFTATRESQGLAVLRHTAADDTSVLMIDITEILRTTASKGFQLDTMDIVFANATADLDAHSATLDRITYADSTTEVVTSMPITGTLGVGQDADPQVDRLTVTTPAFEITALTKIVLEITVNAAATSAYDYIGTVLNFTRNDL